MRSRIRWCFWSLIWSILMDSTMNSVGWIEWVGNSGCSKSLLHMSSTFNVFRSAPFSFDLLLCLGLFGEYNTEEGSTNAAPSAPPAELAEPSAPSLYPEPSHYMED